MVGPVITLGRRKKRTAGKGRRHVRQYLRGSREGRVPRQLSGFYAFFAPPLMDGRWARKKNP